MVRSIRAIHPWARFVFFPYFFAGCWCTLVGNYIRENRHLRFYPLLGSLTEREVDNTWETNGQLSRSLPLTRMTLLSHSCDFVSRALSQWISSFSICSFVGSTPVVTYLPAGTPFQYSYYWHSMRKPWEYIRWRFHEEFSKFTR